MMLMSKMSTGSGASVSLSASEWGNGDPRMGMTSVHVRVLGGQSVWLLAFHKLMVASDWPAFVENWLAGADFVPNCLELWTPGVLFIGHVLRGDAVDWTTCDILPGEVDRMLTELSLYHIQVHCMIPKELGGEY